MSRSNAAIVGITYGKGEKPLALVAARVEMGSQTVMMLLGTQNERMRYPKPLVEMIKFKHEYFTADLEHQRRLDAIRADVAKQMKTEVVFPKYGGTYRVQLAPGGNCPPLHVQNFEDTWNLWRPRHYILIRHHDYMRLTTGFYRNKLQKISLRHGAEGANLNDTEEVAQEFHMYEGDDDAARMLYLLDTLNPLHKIGKVENYVFSPDHTLAWMHHVYELRRWFYINRLRDAESHEKKKLSKQDAEQLEKTRKVVQPPRNIFDTDAQSMAHLQRLLEALRRRPVKRTAAREETPTPSTAGQTPSEAVQTAAASGAWFRSSLTHAEKAAEPPRPLKRANAMARAAPPSSLPESASGPSPT